MGGLFFYRSMELCPYSVTVTTTRLGQQTRLRTTPLIALAERLAMARDALGHTIRSCRLNLALIALDQEQDCIFRPAA
jgi:hypothetical protein